MTKQAILSNRLYVPRHLVRSEHLDAYTYSLIDPNDDEQVIVENYREFDEYVGFCRGNLDKLHAIFHDFEIDDQRSLVPFKAPLKFVGKLWKEQQAVYYQWIESGYGIIQAPPRWGKCLRSSSFFQDADTGERLTIGESVGKQPNVFSLQEDNNIAVSRAAKIWKSGQKPCIKVILASGQWISGSDDHPVLTPTGYRQLGDLHKRDFVAVARKIPAPQTTLTISDIEVIAVAALIADGCNLHHNQAIYCKGNATTFNRAKIAFAEVLGYDGETTWFEKGAWHTRLRGVLPWVRKWGLDRMSKEKHVPAKLFGLNDEQLALLIRWIWSDGNVYISKPYKIEITLASERLIDDLQYMLRRFGIVARKSYKPKRAKKGGERYPAWRLQIADAYNQKLFLDRVGPPVGAEATCKDLASTFEARGNKCNWDVAPAQFNELKEIRESLGIRGDRKWELTRGRCIDYRRFQQLLTAAGYTGKYAWWASPDIVWERVAEIRNEGVQDVYDLTVPGTHNAIVNGIVAHNTVWTTHLITKLKQRALILVHRIDLAGQWLSEMRKFTNVSELEEKLGRPLIGVWNSKEHVALNKDKEHPEPYPIATVSTYQAFTSKRGAKALHRMKNDFGLVGIDECHTYDTPVLIDYDKSMPIGKVVESSTITEVLAYDLKSKRIEKKKIVRKQHRKYSGPLCQITFEQEDGTLSAIEPTPNHKYFVVGKGYVRAENIQVGDQLITYDGTFSPADICPDCGDINTDPYWHRVREHDHDKKVHVCPECGFQGEGRNINGHMLTHKDKDWYKTFREGVAQRSREFWKSEQGIECAKEMGSKRKGKNNPLLRAWGSKEKIRSHMRKTQKRWWASMGDEERERRIKTFINAPKHNKLPNAPESTLIGWNIPGLKYVGDGSLFLTLRQHDGSARKKNPDFVYKTGGKVRKIIEIMDFEYWHTQEEASEIVSMYDNLGYPCLAIDAARFKTEVEIVRAEVEAFLNNHLATVTNVRIKKTSGRQRLDNRVFSLEVEDHHNYFVVARKVLKSNQMGKRTVPVLVSNCHVANSPTFTRVINKLNPEYRIGITATPYRSKDQLHVIVHDTVGSVVAIGKEESLPVNYNFVTTNLYVKRPRDWTTYINKLARDDERNELIARWVIQDVHDGHHVLVTTERANHTINLKNWITLLAPELEGKVAILNGSVKKSAREPLRERLRHGELKVLVAMNSIVQAGYNVPRWSSLHNTMPMTNPENWYQRLSRIRTPYLESEAEKYGAYDKPDPVCRVYIDRGTSGMIWGYYNCVKEQCKKYKFAEIQDELRELPDT